MSAALCQKDSLFLFTMTSRVITGRRAEKNVGAPSTCHREEIRGRGREERGAHVGSVGAADDS